MGKVLCKLFGHKWKLAPWAEEKIQCCVRCGVVERNGIIFKRYFREYVKNGPLGTAEIGYDTVLAESSSWARMLNKPSDMYGYSERFITIQEIPPKHILLSDKDFMLVFQYPIRYSY